MAVKTVPVTSVSRPEGLRHPAWWAALVVLLLNDHVLKGAGLLPGWLTGKLSDLAGLIVAPVLAVKLVGAAGRERRTLAFGAVAAAFAAIKLSEPAARAMESTVSFVGLHWHIWSDRTDLVALAILPLAWKIAARTGATAEPRGTWSARTDTLLAALGGLACAATSNSGPDRLSTSIYLVNATRDPIELEVHRARAPLDCAALATSPEVALAAVQFDLEGCRKAEPFEVLPLDQGWRALDAPDAHGLSPDAPPPCDAIVLRAPGLSPVTVLWGDVPPVVVEKDTDFGPRDDHRLTIEQVGNRLVVAPGKLASARPFTSTLPAPSCGGTR